MARIAKVIDLPSIVKLNKADGQITTQLINILREAVQKGDLHSGDPLPSSRELAQTLGIARGTVIEAYDQLIAEGVLEARSRQGTFVSHALKCSSPQIPSTHQIDAEFLPDAARTYAEIFKRI